LVRHREQLSGKRNDHVGDSNDDRYLKKVSRLGAGYEGE
jgi:hypothetical protein